MVMFYERNSDYQTLMLLIYGRQQSSRLPYGSFKEDHELLVHSCVAYSADSAPAALLR
jgi:hypothetical protein